MLAAFFLIAFFGGILFLFYYLWWLAVKSLWKDHKISMRHRADERARKAAE